MPAILNPDIIFLWYKNGGRVSERQWLDVQGVMKVQGQQLLLSSRGRKKYSTSLEMPSFIA